MQSGTPSPARGDVRVTPVLVVDDLREQRAATVTTLAGDGYRTLTEHDGDAILELVRTQIVRLVVSELYIPCSHGRCVVACLKQERGRLPELRVLVHTRHMTEADAAWALDTGCDGIVPKSASPAVLLREVRRLDPFEPPRARMVSDVRRSHPVVLLAGDRRGEAVRSKLPVTGGVRTGQERDA